MTTEEDFGSSRRGLERYGFPDVEPQAVMPLAGLLLLVLVLVLASGFEGEFDFDSRAFPSGSAGALSESFLTIVEAG